MLDLRTDQDVVKLAAAAARAHQDGTPFDDASIAALRHAITSTREEQQRHELLQQSHAVAGELGTAALQLLRVAIFALA